MTGKPANQKLIKVVLDRQHTHAGEKYAAGATVSVSEPEAAWLEKNKVGKRKNAPTGAKGGAA